MLIRCEIAQREKFEIEQGIHRYNSLVIVLQGEFEYSVGNDLRRILPFEPVIFKKGVSFLKKVIKPIEFIIISSLQFSFECSSFPVYSQGDKIRLENTVKHLIHAIKEDASDNIKEHFINDIFLTSEKSKELSSENFFLPAYDYINKNFTKNLSLNLLAKVNCCSIQTLISRFKKYTGKTPIAYITELRLKKAKELLINTDLSIGQISSICGYENAYYFSNTFKKEIGISPLKFRNGALL